MPVRSLEDPSNVKNYHPKGLFKRFVSYYKPHKKLFVLDMLASFFISAIGLLYPIVTQLMFKTYIPNADYFMIAVLCGVILVLYIIRMLLRYFVQYQGHVMGTLMQAQMRRDMFEHLEKLPYSFYDNHETGRIMSRMTNDLQDVSELAHHGPENFFISGFMVVGTFVYLMCLNVYLTLIIFATVPFLCMFVWKMRKGMARAFMESRRSIASINASMENSITGIRVTKAFNNASEEEKKFAKIKNQISQNNNSPNPIPLNPDEEREYMEYVNERFETLANISRLVSVVDYNGMDVSQMDIALKFETLSNDARIDFGMISALTKHQEGAPFGIKPYVRMKDPITGKSVERRFSFRIPLILQAIQISGSSQYDDGSYAAN